jgi:hypothetical protein
MNTSTIERSSTATHDALGRIQKLEPRSKRGKVANATDRRMASPTHGSVRRWQRLFASFLRRAERPVSKNVANRVISGGGL